MSATAPPASHHIFCAGASGAAFARLALEALWHSCPKGIQRELRVFVHLDALSDHAAREIAAMLSEAPHATVTRGLFGISDPRKAINWHQRMINRISELFSHEWRIAFVDADLFLGEGEWWECATAAHSPSVYSHSLGLRSTRRLVMPGELDTFAAIKTVLFTLAPKIHNALNTQIQNKDEKAAAQLLAEFPGATLQNGPFVDTMVVSSLRAQAFGGRVMDMSARVSAAHIGGFSHIDIKKLASGKSSASPDNWLRRLRLFHAVAEVIRNKGWGKFLAEENLRAAEQMLSVIRNETMLDGKYRNLKPSGDEIAFQRLMASGL